MVQPQAVNAYQEKFMTAMNDDFNTPVAFSVLFDLAHEIQRLRSEKSLDSSCGTSCDLKKLGSVLGILQQQPDQFFQGAVGR